MKRPETFEEIKGHPWLIQYLENHVRNGTLHHFLILEGAEGLGKTSIADLLALSLVYGIEQSPERKEAYNRVVVKGESNDYIKRFKLSVDGGKDVAVQVKDEMNATFNLNRPKVIICDECHGLTKQAQDVFLSETEFIDDKVYVIMLTTEVDKLKPSLRSRAVPIHLNTLKQADMIAVLRNEVSSRGLHLQNENAILTMIAEWSECKPRTGLNILNAFGNGSSVSTSAIRELIGYMDVQDVLPVLSSLSGSMTFGLSYINEMKIDSSMVNLVIECLAVKSGNSSYKLKMTDIYTIKEQLMTVSEEQLVTFLYGITKNPTLTKTDVINAYISAHSSRSLIVKEDTSEMLAVEDTQRADIQQEIEGVPARNACTIDDLLLNSSVVMEDR